MPREIGFQCTLAPSSFPRLTSLLVLAKAHSTRQGAGPLVLPQSSLHALAVLQRARECPNQLSLFWGVATSVPNMGHLAKGIAEHPPVGAAAVDVPGTNVLISLDLDGAIAFPSPWLGLGAWHGGKQQ